MAVSPQLVRSVQDSLQAQGIDAGSVDGIWGPRTHRALREFQDRQGLDTTGQLDAQTLAELDLSAQQTASAEDSASAGGSASGVSRFEKADKDNNGYVSREEFESALARR
jgi:peptidoglycan hydrolase-like protein with peptidoglycan-binding domain